MLNRAELESAIFQTALGGGTGGHGGNGVTHGGSGGSGEGASMTNHINTNSLTMNNWTIGLTLDDPTSLLAGFLNIEKKSTGASDTIPSLLEEMCKPKEELKSTPEQRCQTTSGTSTAASGPNFHKWSAILKGIARKKINLSITRMSMIAVTEIGADETHSKSSCWLCV
ncbi:hypothetical protein R3P38DRAFT_2757628 [Favolaschia claudopus]|uniref:Uncharacterized protein n=1 Tax=Favolaschia claudopus TaxID=2862362 RepID=A0AAW0EKP5_9AGAR